MAILALIGGGLSSIFKFLASLPWQVWLLIIAGVIAAIIYFNVEGAFKKDQQKIASLTTQLTNETNAYNSMKSGYDQIAALNRTNASTCSAELTAAGQNVTIARQAAAAAATRAANYARINDAIKAAPPSAVHTVSPVVQSAVDGLWD